MASANTHAWAAPRAPPNAPARARHRRAILAAWLNTCVAALVATIWCRVRAVRTKKMSSSGPATPAVRLVTAVTSKARNQARGPGGTASSSAQFFGSQTSMATSPSSRNSTGLERIDGQQAETTRAASRRGQRIPADNRSSGCDRAAGKRANHLKQAAKDHALQRPPPPAGPAPSAPISTSPPAMPKMPDSVAVRKAVPIRNRRQQPIPSRARLYRLQHRRPHGPAPSPCATLRATRPPASIRKVARSMPIYLRPYMRFFHPDAKGLAQRCHPHRCPAPRLQLIFGDELLAWLFSLSFETPSTTLRPLPQIRCGKRREILRLARTAARRILGIEIHHQGFSPLKSLTRAGRAIRAM
jgi:hypothetical protein